VIDMPKKAVKKINKNVKEKEEERVIPFKNYLILLFICLATIGVAFGASTIYRREETKKLEVPVIRGAVPEIAVDNLANYVVENQSFFLYIGTTIDPNSREIEKDLIDYFKKRDISKNMVYLNLSDTNSEEFFKDFNKNYVKIDNIKVDNYPAFIIFKDGVVLDKVQKEGNIKLGVGDIDRLLDEYSY
jgi:hypothetical protein